MKYPLLNPQAPPAPAAPVRDKKKLRYGWLRLYEDFSQHPKWRVVSMRTGVHLAFVQAIAVHLFCTASKARPQRGSLANLDFDECAVATGVPLDDVAKVVTCLNSLGWIDGDWIVDWHDRQPDEEDVTAAERQRNKRAKDKAKRALAMGTATPAQKALVSRVTAGEPAIEPKDQPIQPLVLVRPEGTSAEDVEVARQANVRTARYWLFGDGTTSSYGPASRIVSDYLGQKQLSADMTMHRWLEEIGDDDVVNLAEIIAETDKQALNGRAFENTVNQRIAALVKLKAAKTQPNLPLRPGLVKR